MYRRKQCHISWPLFLFFIINEKKEYRFQIYNNDNSLEYKNINRNNFIQNRHNINKIINESNDEYKELFLKWRNNSCRYDCFFFLFTFVIYKKIKNISFAENRPYIYSK